MSSSRIALVTAIALALFITPQAMAEEAEEASSDLAAEAIAPAGSEVSTAVTGAEVTETPELEPTAEARSVELGPVGYDENGQAGRIHVVVPGDTLWDISDAYLGTPWVWPSVWRENQGIENPHLILPGDRIWITATEMRRVTEEEAERLLSSAPIAEEAVPAAMEDATASPDEDTEPRPTYHFAGIEATGFVTKEEFEGATTIVDSHVPRVWLGDSDTVIIGRGSGAVEVGDQFEIFRPGERVYDPTTGDVFGLAAKQLGWLEVDEVHPETATGTIRLSRSEIRRGDHLLPRMHQAEDVEILPAPNVEGRILFTPNDQLNMGAYQIVFLDRGLSHGIDVGSPLEVYRHLGVALDTVQGKKVALPDQVVAKLLVVGARPDTAVALVTYTTAELMRGDLFRGSDSVSWASR
jgi:hypothetical protein